jgi:hypothetical protein
VLSLPRLIYIPRILIVHGNATATANNIAAHESLFRWSIVSYLLAYVLWIFVVLALYRLLKEVNQALAVVMVILGALMPVPIAFVNTMTDAAALLLVRGADFLSVFDKPQREALALLFLNLHHQLDLAYLIFAGLWLLSFGLLVYRSRFLPRFLGVWLIMGCFAWLAVSFTGFLLPGHEDKVFTIGQPFGFGEVAIMLWLAIRGAKPPTAVTATSSSA